jgi:mRNA interferase MazF
VLIDGALASGADGHSGERARGGSRRALVGRGEVVWLEGEDAGRRPVLVLTRDEALQRLRNVVVALITRTVRGIDTEVELGPDDGYLGSRYEGSGDLSKTAGARLVGGGRAMSSTGTPGHSHFKALRSFCPRP